GILFLTINAVVIIFSSDLNVYANQALIIIIPFAIGAIGVLMVGTYTTKKKQPKEQIGALLLDYVILCPFCKQKTALGGNFCEKCGEKLLQGSRLAEGNICPRCNKLNPDDSIHCRYCGEKLKEA
ncbi:MAG: zinc ribbon domain-containing protein, partial [Promethearchaeota archaeon]